MESTANTALSKSSDEADGKTTTTTTYTVASTRIYVEEGSQNATIFANGCNQVAVTVSAEVMQTDTITDKNGDQISQTTYYIQLPDSAVEFLVFTSGKTLDPATNGWGASMVSGDYTIPVEISDRVPAVKPPTTTETFYSYTKYVSTTKVETLSLGVSFTYPDKTSDNFNRERPGSILNCYVKGIAPIDYSVPENLQVEEEGWKAICSNLPYASSLGYPGYGRSMSRKVVITARPPPYTLPRALTLTSEAVDPVFADNRPSLPTLSSDVIPDAVNTIFGMQKGGNVLAWYLMPNYLAVGAVKIGFGGTRGEVPIVFTDTQSIVYTLQPKSDADVSFMSPLASGNGVPVYGVWLTFGTGIDESISPKNWAPSQQFPARSVTVIDNFGNSGTFCVDFNVTDSIGEPTIAVVRA